MNCFPCNEAVCESGSCGIGMSDVDFAIEDSADDLFPEFTLLLAANEFMFRIFV